MLLLLIKIRNIMTTTEIGCPRCGNTLNLAPPDTIHTIPSTDKPDKECIERSVLCPDSISIPSRRIPHKVTIYWS